MKIKINNELEHITDRTGLLQDFIVFTCKDLQCMPCDVDIVNGRDEAGLKTTAQYDPNSQYITVNGKNRHFGDVLRSIAHELVHHKQNVNGELEAVVQDVGGDIEDEANARAGAMLKSFAYNVGPERIYEGRSLISEKEESASKKLESQLSTFLKNIKADVSSSEDEDEEEESDSLSVKKFSNNRLPHAAEKQKSLEILAMSRYEKKPFEPILGMPAPSLSDDTKKIYKIEGHGVPVHAIFSGFVLKIGNEKEKGNFIEILSNVQSKDKKTISQYITDYMHLGEKTNKIKPGENIRQGEIIGYTSPDIKDDKDDNNFSNDYFEIRIVHISNIEVNDPEDPNDDKRTRAKDQIKDLETFTINEAANNLLSLKNQFIKKVFKVVPPAKKMEISSPYGSRTTTIVGEDGKPKEINNTHRGIDIRTDPLGESGKTTVYSSVYGVVADIRDGKKSYNLKTDKCPPGTAAGNYIKIKPIYSVGDQNLTLFFAHLHEGSIFPEVGDLVEPGKAIGLMGMSGCTTGPHLHFEIRKGGKNWNLAHKHSNTTGRLKSYESLKDEITSVADKFKSVISDDEKFLKLFEATIPEQFRKPEKSMSESKVPGTNIIKQYINEVVSAYGVGRIDPTQGGVGQMFRMGVDYKNASTNIPHAAAGYVDRTRSLPYEISIRSDRDAKKLYETFFKGGFVDDKIVIQPDDVHYTTDGFKMDCHVSTGSNAGNDRDVNLIQRQLYSSMLGIPSMPKNASIIIDVIPKETKIK